jgi:hypothetical protein
MAGSLTYRSYTGDDGISYSIRVDESNANGVVQSSSNILLPVRTADLPPLPTGLKPRYVLARSIGNPNIKRKFYVGVPSDVGFINLPGSTITCEDYPGAGGTAGAATVFIITAYRGEKINKIPSFTALDTGLTDGTAGQ